MRTFILLVCLALGACSSPINLKNQATGQIATCGPFASTWDTAVRENQCISDYQRQGFERQP